MSAEPASDAKQQLHNLIDEMSEERATEFLQWLDFEGMLHRQPLTSQQIEEIERRLAESVEGDGIPHEEIAAQFGVRG